MKRVLRLLFELSLIILIPVVFIKFRPFSKFNLIEADCGVEKSQKSVFVPKDFKILFFDEVHNMVCSSDTATKAEIHRLLEELKTEGEVIRSGDDAINRPVFVSTQANIEKVMAYMLAAGKIRNLMGIIHTPAPATPLCTEGRITEGLVDPSMKDDDKRLYTVKTRAQIVRDYLEKDGILYALYPIGGYQKRSKEQLQILEELLDNYPINLKSKELNCSVLKKDMSGATYLFKGPDSKIFVFGIMAPQAIFAHTNQEWGMWFGEISDSPVEKRMQYVFQFIKNHDGPDILKNFFSP